MLYSSYNNAPKRVKKPQSNEEGNCIQNVGMACDDTKGGFFSYLDRNGKKYVNMA